MLRSVLKLTPEKMLEQKRKGIQDHLWQISRNRDNEVRSNARREVSEDG